MKRFFSILALCILSLTSWMSISADAQNKMFKKYSDMDDVEYICITKSMLKLLSVGGSATINGVHIDGITNALNIVLIINSDDSKKAQQLMKEDYAKLVADPNYETLMSIKNDGERVETLLNATQPVKEVVMYIDESDGDQVFIVLTGKFTDEQLAKLLNGNNK